NPYAYSRAARCLHGGKLLQCEQLRDTFEGDLGVGANVREDAPDELKQPCVLVGSVEIRGATAEVNARQRRPAQEGPVHLTFTFEIAKIAVELRSPLVHLAGEEAEAAPIRIGRQTVRRRDVEVQATSHPAKSFCPRCHDLGDGEV